MKAIAVLKKLRGLKITMLFEEKGLNPQTIKEIDEALEELEALNTKINNLKRHKLESEERSESVARDGGVYYGLSLKGQKLIFKEIEELTLCK